MTPSKFQWSTAKYPEIIQSQGTRSRWSRGLMICRVIQMINYCQMSRDSVRIEPQMIQVFQPAVLTSAMSTSPSSLSWPSSSWCRCPGGETGQSRRILSSLPKVSKLLSGLCCSQYLHHHNQLYPLHNNQDWSPAHQPPVHLQCVLEEKWVSVGDFSSLPKVSKLLSDLW